MLSKNKYIGRKTRRDNFYDDNLNTKTCTKINLINLCAKKYKSYCYSYIKFSFTERIYLDDLIKFKTQLIELNIQSDKIYIVDRIELGNDIGTKAYFLLPIYINKTNTCYIDLKNKKKNFCFELIFYAKTTKKLPDYILYNNELKLKGFDNYNLKYRKKLIILNVELDAINEYIKNSILDSNSYKICIRIDSKGKSHTSIHELTLDKKKMVQSSKLKANIDHIKDIEKLFDEVKKNKPIESLKEKYNYLKDDDDFELFLKNYDYIDSSYTDIAYINDNDVNILKEYLLKLILKYFFIEIDKNQTERQIIDINNNIIKMIDNINFIIDDIEQFTKDVENSTILRFRLFRSTLYNLYISISEKSSNKFACLEILSQYHQKIIDIKASSGDNPYYNAVLFLKEVADNLSEDSALFDILMQYNSGISDDVNLFNEKQKPKEYNSKYELSMLTVPDVAAHLKNIIPEFMVRFTSDDRINSFYSTSNDLVFINEKRTFKKNDISDLDGHPEYILPIVILLLHECWGHRKVFKSSKIIKDSPIRNYLRSENFNEELNIIINEAGGKKKIKGESGLTIEFLITGDNKSRTFTEFLLNYCNRKNINLLNVKLWVKSNFNEFQELMINNYREIYKKDLNKITNKNREDEMDDDFSVFKEKVFYIDGIKIGPFFKV